MLRVFLHHLKNAAHPLVQHLVFILETNEAEQATLERLVAGTNISLVFGKERLPSIGRYHNLGFSLVQTEWAMKLDVDAMPHAQFFQLLVQVLENASEREWFNVGMFYLSANRSILLLGTATRPNKLTAIEVAAVAQNPSLYGNSKYQGPGGSNFVCRRKLYLSLGGCSDRFIGWGWEDYQQMAMLDYAWRGHCILPRPILLSNCANLVRDVISRPAAKRLIDLDAGLCLLHHWHPRELGAYVAHVEENRKALFDYLAGLVG